MAYVEYKDKRVSSPMRSVGGVLISLTRAIELLGE